MVNKLMESLVELDPDPALKQIWTERRLDFKAFADARNDVEHVDHRIRVETPGLGDLFHGAFVSKQGSVPIDATSLTAITSLYDAVLEVIAARPQWYGADQEEAADESP